MNLSRRHVLQITGVSIASIGAGCTSVPSLSSEETQIESLLAENRYTSEYVVYVQIVEDNESVYFNSLEVEPFDGSSLGEAVFEEHPNEVGDATIYAWVEGQSHSEWEQLNTTELRDDCVKVIVIINGRGELGLRARECSNDGDF